LLQHDLKAEQACLNPEIKFGVLLFGSGKADIDAASLKLNDEVYQDSVSEIELSNKADVLAMKRSAVDLSAQDGISPAKLKSLPGYGRRVLALGENSHGAAALFKMKTRIIQALVKDQAVKVIGLEAPAAMLDHVNAYVHGRHEDRSGVILALAYPSWQSDEMMTLVDWLRQYNHDHEKPVSFLGFDIQRPDVVAENLQKIVLSTKNPVLKGKLNALLTAFNAGEAGLKQLPELAQQFNEPIASDAGLQRDIRLLVHGALSGRPELGGRSRDFYMAEEVLELSKQGPTVIWADNTHVTRVAGSMGHVLREALGKEYFVYGFSYAQGHYAAYGPEKRYPVETAYPGTHEYTLSKLGLTHFAIQLSDLSDSHPLKQSLGFRYVGSSPQRLGEFLPHQLEHHFDAIGFVKTTDSIEYLFDFDF